MSACSGANAVPFSLDAGAGSKRAALYQIKYMGKEPEEVDRTALHFAQRVVESSHYELEATQAAGIVLRP
jgi:hypothetical protein